MKPTPPAVVLFVIALLALVGVAMLPRFAPDRLLRINAPAEARTDDPILVEVAAVTRLDDGESIGFLQVETSVDDGETWQAIAYKSGMGRRGEHWFLLQVDSIPRVILIRARAAFRHGEAGDVDQHGQSLDWDGTWDRWALPPAIMASVTVR